MIKNNHPIKFSPLIIGTMRLGVWGANMTTPELEQFIDQCLELGLKDFDHADIYGHYTEESNFGKVLRKKPGLRQQMQLTTKCGIKLVTENRPAHKIKSYDLTRPYILSCAENSLRELHTDYLDLLLLHRPDYLMDPYEIAEAFEQLAKEGKVRHFGVSNFTPSQVEMLQSFTCLVNNQVEISILHLDAFTDGTLDQCRRHQLIPTAWSPFGGGEIFTQSTDLRIRRIQTTAKELAEKHQAQIDQILLAWLAKHPAGIIPVLGSTKIERIQSAFASTNIKLTHEEWYELWQASTGEEVA